MNRSGNAVASRKRVCMIWYLLHRCLCAKFNNEFVMLYKLLTLKRYNIFDKNCNIVMILHGWLQDMRLNTCKKKVYFMSKNVTYEKKIILYLYNNIWKLFNFLIGHLSLTTLNIATFLLCLYFFIGKFILKISLKS